MAAVKHGGKSGWACARKSLEWAAMPADNITNTTRGLVDHPATGLSRSSMIIAAVSTVIEWYDFTLYLYLATVLSRVVFGGGEDSLGYALAGFALSYLMRPIGAVVFGHIGDRYGRRTTMLASMALMSAAMLATALIPTYAQAGAVSGALLMALRCVMAFSVGGEYTGVVAYLLEGAPRDRRGLVTSSASAFSEVGGLLAVALSALTVALCTEEQLADWGWRLPFFAGALMAAAIVFARARMEESPEFEDQRRRNAVPENPLAHSLRHHRTAIARGFAISALGSITYYVGISYVPVFLNSATDMGEATALWLSTIAAVAVIAVTPLTGLASDRFGRKPVLVAVALGGVLIPISMFNLMAGSSVGFALVGAVVLACLGGAVSAVGAVATAEQFPGEGRLSGLAFGATSATAIFGGLTPWAAQETMGATGSPMVPGVMIALVAICVLPVFWRMAETRPGMAPAGAAPRFE